MELLITVAIIGVLVAISIPIFTSQLEKAREATDEANLRAAYAEGTADLLTETVGTSKITFTDGKATYYYNTTTGALDASGNACGKGTANVVESGTDAYAAFKGTATTGGMEYNGGDVSGKKIQVVLHEGTSSSEAFVYVHFAD